MRGGTKDERTELSETLRDLISRGRAAGMIVIAATQKPSNDIVPTYVRDLFSFRMALRCTTPEASDTILGQGWAKEGYSASTLDPTLRGRGLPAGRRGGPGQDPHPLPRRRRHRRAGQLAEARTRRIAVSVGRPLAGGPGRGRPGRPVRPPGPPARPHLGPLDRRAGRGGPPRRRARTGGPPCARRARASTRPTPGSSWPPGSGAARG